MPKVDGACSQLSPSVIAQLMSWTTDEKTAVADKHENVNVIAWGSHGEGGLGFGVEGLGFRVWGLGFRV